MKFVLNGSLIIGTMDGANVEIHEEVGDENIFIFGAREEEVHGKRDYISQASPGQYIPASLHRVIQVIREGLFAEKDIILSLLNTITSNNDWYLVTQDFESYIECQKKVLLFFIIDRLSLQKQEELDKNVNSECHPFW